MEVCARLLFVYLFLNPSLLLHNLLLCPLPGPPVAVGMSIDVASIDMVSEVNMVSELNMFTVILPATLPIYFFYYFPPYLCVMG